MILTLAVTSQANTITNAIQGVGPNGLIKPYLCLQNADGAITLTLAPDQTGDANRASGEPLHARAHLRFGGCEAKHEDLGTVDIAIGPSIPTPSIVNYTSPNGIHIAYINANITTQGKLMGNIVYTPIQANFNLNPSHLASPSLLTGINLSGLEFGQTLLPSTIPNLSQQDAETPYSDLANIQTFIQAGMNTVRLPIAWNYLQWNGPGLTIINQDYYAHYIKPLLESLTSAKIHTILNLHTNMHYAKYGQNDISCPKQGYCPGGTLILDESVYTYVWEQLWQLIQQDSSIDPDYLLFDLVNAPIHVPDDKVFTIQAAVIKQLRQNGFPGYILIQGNAGSELHDWTTHQWVGDDGQTYSNATLFTRERFIQTGIEDLSKIMISVRQYLDEGYQGTHPECLQDLSTIGPTGFNLEAFAHYLETNQLQAIVTAIGVGRDTHTCTPALSQFMTYLKHHRINETPYGFKGGILWGAGHAWEDYPLRITSNSEFISLLF